MMNGYRNVKRFESMRVIKSFIINDMKIYFESAYIEGVPCLRVAVDFGRGKAVRLLQKRYRVTSIDISTSKVNKATEKTAQAALDSMSNDLNFARSIEQAFSSKPISKRPTHEQLKQFRK